LVSGLFACGVLITLWTYFVMKAVPQLDTDENSPSLERAMENGCISTIPLTEIVRGKQPSLRWVAHVVEAFIMVSVTVSFITVGSGLKNYLDGYLVNLVQMFPVTGLLRKLPKSLHSMHTVNLLCKAVTYFFCFGAVIGFAVGKPTCFLVVLEYFTSMALNLENGAFISYMTIVSIKYAKRGESIPMPLPSGIIRGAYAITVFFLLAAVYGMGSFVERVVTGSTLC